jgi:hypothetical protein
VLGTDAIVVNAAAGDAAAQPPASTPGASRSYTPQSCIN